MRIFLPLILILGLLLGGCLGGAQHDPARHLGDSLISLDTVWNGTIVIDGTVKVAKGATLVIAPGTDIRFVRSDRDQDGLGDATLVVEGELLAIGNERQPIRFRSAEAEPQPGDWLELRVDFSRNTELRWCEIRDSAHTLHAHFTKGVMEDCHIHHNIDGTRLGEARFVIRHNLFEDNLGKGVNFRNTTVEIAWNVFRRNRVGLFLFETDRENAIHHNNFIANGDNLRLGDFFTGTLAVRDNWWGHAEAQAAAETIHDRKQDPEIGVVSIDPADSWLVEAGPRRSGVLKEDWSFATGGFVDSSAVSDGQLLYVSSWDGMLYALDGEGQPIWKAELGDVADAAPLVSDGRLFVQDWSRSVRALDSADGRELWRFAYPASPADDHRQGGLARSGEQLLVPAWNGALYALELADGTPRWEYASDGALRSTPLVLDGLIVIASEDGALHGLAPDGRLLWRYDSGAPLRAAPVALADGLVAVNRDGRVVALSRDGALRWQHDLGEECFYAAPLVADDAVLVATAAGTLWKLDAASGEPLWRVAVGSPLFATPLAVDGVVLFGDNCGRLNLFDLLSGARLGSFSAGDAIQSPLLQLGRQLIFGSRDGKVHALEPTSGENGEGA